MLLHYTGKNYNTKIHKYINIGTICNNYTHNLN
jgi:hypothetical protein